MKTTPLIAIVGATGTGKSDLAVAIARALAPPDSKCSASNTDSPDQRTDSSRTYGAEIINGDALQLYTGLPITTNKISESEQAGVPHHLLGLVPVFRPEDQIQDDGLSDGGSGEDGTWTVSQFVAEASRLIDEIASRGNVPILVGGTHYYVQALLFRDSLELDLSQPQSTTNQQASCVTSDEQGITAGPVEPSSSRLDIDLDAPTTDLAALLTKLDPAMAARWHPNDRRKIRRSLEIYAATGKPASALYHAQAQQAESESGPVLRRPTLILWPHTDMSLLRPRLDKRVDTMVSRGLLDELADLEASRQTHEGVSGVPTDLTRGIWAAIGVRQFSAYFNALARKEDGRLQFEDGLEKMKAATRQYAKRQIRWIRLKLVNAVRKARSEKHSQGDVQAHMYILPYQSVDRFEQDVVDQAVLLTRQFLSHNDRARLDLPTRMPRPDSLSNVSAGDAALLEPERDDLSTRPDLWQRNECVVCGVVATTQQDWQKHISGRRHKMAVSRRERNPWPARPDN